MEILKINEWKQVNEEERYVTFWKNVINLLNEKRCKTPKRQIIYNNFFKKNGKCFLKPRQFNFIVYHYQHFNYFTVSNKILKQFFLKNAQEFN